MRRMIVSILFITVAMVMSGCTPVRYKKTVVTTLDGNGKTVSTVITETLSEPHSELQNFPSARGAKFNRIKQ